MPRKKKETALVVQEEIPLVDAEGREIQLRPNQHQYLKALAAGKSQKESREVAGGISRQAVHLWMRNPEFKVAYDHLFGVGMIETHRDELLQAAADTTDLYQEALKAKKPKVVNYTCRECGTKGSVSIEVDDWNARLRAAEKLDQIAGLLKDTKTVQGTINVIDWEAADKIAFEQWKAGLVIPDANKDRLKKLGIPVDGYQEG